MAGRPKRQYFKLPIESAPLLIKLSLATTVVGFCTLLIRNAFSAPMSAVTGGYFGLVLMPPLLTCLKPTSSITQTPSENLLEGSKLALRNTFWMLYKLTCFYSGSVVFLREVRLGSSLRSSSPLFPPIA